ncbi:MAG: hypothetical protein MZV64_04105 [Ignavibacteriales bacterium]|nr:hypothetical protein [Ignavibacteriales bacterium]
MTDFENMASTRTGVLCLQDLTIMAFSCRNPAFHRPIPQTPGKQLRAARRRSVRRATAGDRALLPGLAMTIPFHGGRGSGPEKGLQGTRKVGRV